MTRLPDHSADGAPFCLERLHSVRAPAGTRLCAHPARVAALPPEGGLLVCSADGPLELCAGTSASDPVEVAAWSPCGRFLALGDRLGRFRLFHVASQIDVYSAQIVEVDQPLEDGADDFEPVFRELHFVEGPGSTQPLALLVLLTSGMLVHMSNFELARLDEELGAAAKQDGAGIREALSSLGSRLSSFTHELGADAQRLCVSMRGCRGGSVRCYACGAAGVSVFELAGDRCELRDAVELPVLMDSDDTASNSREAPANSNAFAGEISPLKRRRLSGDLKLAASEDCTNMLCFTLWPASASSPSDGHASDGADLADSFDTILTFVFRHPGTLVLYSASMLSEVYRWRPQDGGDIVAAQRTDAPERLAPGGIAGELDDQGAERMQQVTSTIWLVMSMILQSGEFLVCAFPEKQVLFSLHVAPCGPAWGRSFALAAPNVPLAHDAGRAAVAFLCTRGGASGDEELLSVLRCAVDEEALDEGADQEDTMMQDTVEGPGMGTEGRSTASLRHQMEHFMERAVQGKLDLLAAAFLRLAQPLMVQIPGFVVGSVVRAYFVDAAETREALQGTLHILQREGVPVTYDVPKGAAILTDALARLATFEYLHGALAAYPEQLVDEAPPIAEEPPPRRPDRRSLAAPCTARPDRRSLAAPSAEASTPPSKRRHSLPSFGGSGIVLGACYEEPSGSLVDLLARMSSHDFCTVWHRFRREKLPQVCVELVQRAFHVEALGVFSRHGGKFKSEDVMELIGAFPTSLADDVEERLPLWLAREALPLIGKRLDLLKWLASRAELLESQRGGPAEALRLLGNFLAAAAPDVLAAGPLAASSSGLGLGASGALRFPGARVAQGAFWSGAPLLAAACALPDSAQPDAAPPEQPRSRTRSAEADNVPALLELYRQLRCCEHIARAHSLKVSLKELRQPQATRRIAARLLDRVLAPDLVGEEVRAHVVPLCRWLGESPDDALEAYTLELAESLHLPSGEVRLGRAAAVLRCIESPERSAHCLVKILERWRGSEVPEALQPLVGNESAWPPAVRTSVRAQISLLHLQQALQRYGAGTICSITHPEYAIRFVLHLLSRVDGGATSLRDALSVLDVYPQRLSRAEALCVRLEHVASAVEAGGADLEELRREAVVTLDCAKDADERLAAANCFAVYCNDLLGEWSDGIAVKEGERAEGNTSGASDAVRAWKSAYTALCTLGVAVLQRAAMNSGVAALGGATVRLPTATSLEAGGAADAAIRAGRWHVSEAHFDMLTRLKQLTEEFGLYLDPLNLAPRVGGSPSADGREQSPDPDAAAIFEEHSKDLLESCFAAWKSEGSGEGAASGSNAFTRLLRLGGLLGVGHLYVHQTIVMEASLQGLPSVCRKVIAKLLDSQALADSTNLVDLVRSLLRHVCESRHALRKPAELILQLTNIEETITSCLRTCTDEDLGPLLELSMDVQFTVEVLLSSDLLDTLARIPSAWPKLQELPVAHAHHLGSLLKGEVRQEAVSSSAGANVDMNILQQSFLEIPLLISGSTATQVSLDYLGSVHANNAMKVDSQSQGAPVPAAPPLDRLLETLRSSECVELATGLLLRHPEGFPGDELPDLCRERSVVVLRAGNPIDNQLAVTYMSCLNPQDASQLFVNALSYLRTEQHRTEHHRLQRMARLGSDLGALYGNPGLRENMLMIERHAKWSQLLALLEVPFDSARLSGRAACQPPGAAPRPADTQATAAYARQLLPRVLWASQCDLQLALEFGRDNRVASEEVVALWVEVCLSSGSPVARSLLLQVPPILGLLPKAAAEDLLLGRVLPAISAYDYDRLGTLLELLPQNAQTNRRVKVLKTLSNYTRRSPPSAAELQQVDDLATRLAQRQPPDVVAAVTSEARRQAEKVLPWHPIALSADPWPTLEPEMRRYSSLTKLLPLHSPLALDPDNFYISFLRSWEPHADGADGHGAEGSQDECATHQVLLQIGNTQKALEIAKSLEERTPLGPERIAIARSRLGLLQRQAGSRACQPGGEPGDSGLAEGISDMQRRVSLLESRWDLAQAGLTILDSVLAQLDARACVACLYHCLPTLFHWAERHGQGGCTGDTGGIAGASASVRRLGVQGVHELVDAICRRHGLSPKLVRHQLMEQWVADPRRELTQIPPELAEAEAAELSLLAQMNGTGGPGSASEAKAVEDSPARTRSASSGAEPLGDQLFLPSPQELLCLERLAFLAQPCRRSGGSDAPKESREDAKVRAQFLLKLVFTKETRMAYDAKCRALTVLFRIASLQDIGLAYRNPVEELCEIWKLYFYMDIFERLGMPQDFKRFYQCNKDGLVRSLWRSHQTDPRMVQVIAALCLDFGNTDSRFWSSILARLHQLHLHNFLRDVLAAMHDRAILDLPHDPELVKVLVELFQAPMAALRAWVQSQGQTAVPCLASWLPLLPHLLRRSPFLAAFDPVAMARQVLSLAGSQAITGDGAFVRLSCAVFGRSPQPAAASGGSAVSVERDLRERLGIIAVDLAMCTLSPAQLDDFLQEDVVAGNPQLVFACLPRCAGIAKDMLFEGILQHRLVAEARDRLDAALFGDLVEYAVRSKDIQELLEAALKSGQIDRAKRLLVYFAQAHHLSCVEAIVARPGDGGGGGSAAEDGGSEPESEAAAYLIGVLDKMRTAQATGVAYADLVRQMRSISS